MSKFLTILNKNYPLPVNYSIWNHKNKKYIVLNTAIVESTYRFSVIYNNLDNPGKYPFSKSLKEWNDQMTLETEVPPFVPIFEK